MGLLSNPVAAVQPAPAEATSVRVFSAPPRQSQRRLGEHEVAELLVRYMEGESVLDLAGAYGIHRTTVTAHLERHGVARRGCTRRMTDAVVEAAEFYAQGESLESAASRFGVSSRTLAREFRAVGVPIRPRQGLQ